MKVIFIAICILFFSFPTDSLGQYLDMIPTQSNTLLWKIEGKKIKKDCYIFGTVHLIDKEQFYFPTHFSDKLKKSEQIILEISNINQAEALKYMLLEKGTFFEFFTPEQTDSILVWVENELKMDPAKFKLTFNKMKPFAIIQLASQKDLMGKIESYDLTIQSIANENNIPVYGLETIEQQMAIFDNMDTLQIQEMVMEGVRNPDAQEELLQELYETYLKQNVDVMHDLISKEKSGMMQSSEELLYNRNKNWVPKIEDFIRKKATIIAVGAGHLGGEQGVLRLLEKEGYTLLPIHF